MIRSGELWASLWPSLLVLLMGLSLAIVFGTLLGLALARFRILDVGLTVYITFLYSIPSVALVPLIVLWAGYETTAKVIILFLFALLPDGDQHLSGREVGRSRSCSRSAARSAARSGSCGPTSCCPARCRSSSPASGSRSAAA